jgi:hypothetical protein
MTDLVLFLLGGGGSGTCTAGGRQPIKTHAPARRQRSRVGYQ